MSEKEWDQHEIALLIETYQSVKQGADLNQSLADLSFKLRKLGLKAGMNVDDKYRNINGMHWQYGYIKLAFEKKNFLFRTPPKKFLEMVNLYCSNKDAFRKILDEAHELCQSPESSSPNKRYFINWVSANKIKGTDADGFANSLERIFSVYCASNVWNIDSAETYNALRQDLLRSQKFKKEDKTDYKIFNANSRLYLIFLQNKPVNQVESNSSVPAQKKEETNELSNVVVPNEKDLYVERKEKSAENTLHSFEEASSSTSPNDNVASKELEEIQRFFSSIEKKQEYSATFWKLFKYSKNKRPDSLLDVRTAVIGVKESGERLRYYVTKEGKIHFSKVSFSDNSTCNLLDTPIANFFGLIDQTNEYFSKYPEQIKLGSGSLPSNASACLFVKHDHFGKGTVKEDGNDVLTILFDGETQPRRISKSYKGLSFISEKEYKSQETPEGDGQKVPDSSEILEEERFKNWISGYYSEKHSSDGKASNATTVAQHSIERIREIDSFSKERYHKSFYAISTVEEGNSVIEEGLGSGGTLNRNKQSWYKYTFSLYKLFRKDNGRPLEYERKKEPNQKAAVPEDYVKVLDDYFPEGFPYLNPLRKRAFIKRYSESNGVDFSDSDGQYIKKIKLSGFESENKIYPLSSVDDKVRVEIHDFITRSFKESTNLIYYTALFDIFKERLPSYFSVDMMKSYLSVAFADQFEFTEDFLRKLGTKVSVKEEVLRVFQSAGTALPKEELYKRVPSVDRNAIDELLKSDSDFIVNERGTSYFPTAVFTIEDDELEQVRKFLKNKMPAEGFVKSEELVGFIRQNLPNVAEGNPTITEGGIFNYFKKVLGDDFNFTAGLISPIGKEIDPTSLYTDLCKAHETFSIQDLLDVREKNQLSNIYFEVIFDFDLRIDSKTFVRRDLVSFDTKGIDQAISEYCPRNYIGFNDIITYVDFPAVQGIYCPWNDFLLESYLYKGSDEFILVHPPAFNRSSPVGGIVKKSSKIQSFDDLVVQIIIDNHLHTKEDTLDFLAENRFIKRRRISNLEELLERAKKEGI
ncbi:MAG: hypothetical protein PUE07_05185 [bacterium]|nr:hypothetical protein [bacterium]